MTRKIAVMCGHGKSLDGSWDGGCAWGMYTEAALMLPITQSAVRHLRAKGIAVLSDADTGNDKNMIACVEWANKEKAEIYISIHCDYSGAPIGVMPLYVSDKGKKLAEDLNRAITSGMDMASRGIQKRVDLYELNETEMPAVVLETGSIKLDLAFLKNFDKYGKCICEGICNYLGIEEEPKQVSKEYKKYKALRAVNVYKDHSIKSGKVGTAKKGSIYTGTDWYRDDWVKIPYLGGWVPIKGSLGTYLEPVTKLVYTVTNDHGVNIYPDPEHKGKMILNVKKGAELTATKWTATQAYFPEVKGWGAISCVRIGDRRDTLIWQLQTIGAFMAAERYTYSTKNLQPTLAKSKKDKRTDCAHYVSYAMQAVGLIPYGKCFWLDKTIHGTAAADIKASPVLSVSYPNKDWKDLNLKPGDVVGYGYTVKGVKGQHTQVFAGTDKLGRPLWYSGGTSDVNGRNYGPKLKPTYAARKVNVLIRIK